MASWVAVMGEEGISHLLNELIRAQRFHFEEASGLSLDFCDTGFAEIRRGRGDFQHLLPGRFYGREVVGFNVYVSEGHRAAVQRQN